VQDVSVILHRVFDLLLGGVISSYGAMPGPVTNIPRHHVFVVDSQLARAHDDDGMDAFGLSLWSLGKVLPLKLIESGQQARRVQNLLPLSPCPERGRG
jgi:hypothetical protein